MKIAVRDLKKLLREESEETMLYPVLQIYRGPDVDEFDEERILHFFRDKEHFVRWMTDNVSPDFDVVQYDQETYWSSDDDYNEDGPGVWEYYGDFFRMPAFDRSTPDHDHRNE